MESLDLIKKFWQLNEKKPLGSSAVAMYFLIINEWKNTDADEIVLSDAKISETLKIVRNTVRATKDKLQEAGLLTYETKIGFPCVYRLKIDNNIFTSAKENEDAKDKDVQSVSEEPKQEVKVAEEKQPIQEPKIKSLLDKNTQPKVPVKKQESNPVPKQEPVVEKPKLSSNIPSIEEFLSFAKTLEIYDATNKTLDFQIKTKYEKWVSDGWKNGWNKPIRNWQLSLRATLPHLLTNNPVVKAPVIKRPKSTYNE